MKARLFQRSTQSGFTLIEMLIALVIFVIALLAIGLLQLRGIAMTRDANMRTTAIFAARSLGEAIKANPAIRYNFPASNSSPTGQIVAMAACPVTLGRGISSNTACYCFRDDADIEAAFNISNNLPDPLSGGKIAVVPLALRPQLGSPPPTTPPTPAVSSAFLAPATCAALEGQPYLVTVRWSEGTGAIGIQDQSVSVVVMP